LEKVEGKILLLAHADLTKDHCDPRGRGKDLEILKGSVAHKRTVRSESFFYKKIKILNTKKDTEDVKFLEKKLTRAWNGAKKDNKNLEY
jgi:hypothetical protein